MAFPPAVIFEVEMGGDCVPRPGCGHGYRRGSYGFGNAPTWFVLQGIRLSIGRRRKPQYLCRFGNLAGRSARRETIATGNGRETRPDPQYRPQSVPYRAEHHRFRKPWGARQRLQFVLLMETGRCWPADRPRLISGTRHAPKFTRTIFSTGAATTTGRASSSGETVGQATGTIPPDLHAV